MVCMKILTAAEMGEADRASVTAGVSMTTLMQHAGEAVARFVRSQYSHAQRVTVLCGTGNNGGDGFVAAKTLADAGVDVAVLLVGDEAKLKGEAADAYSLLDGRGVAVFAFEPEGLDALLSGADLLLDAVTGTGFKAPLRGDA